MNLNVTDINLGFLALASLLLVWAAVSDVRAFRIPNLVSLMLLVLLPGYLLSSPHEMLLLQRFFVFGIVLAIGIFLFAKGIAGAGDAKLMACVALWVGVENIAIFLSVTALTGGVFSLFLALSTWLRNRHKSEEEKMSLSRIPVPYGLAIALGGLLAFWQMAYPLLFNSLSVSPV